MNKSTKKTRELQYVLEKELLLKISFFQRTAQNRSAPIKELFRTDQFL